jgi:hypothetical protein
MGVLAVHGQVVFAQSGWLCEVGSITLHIIPAEAAAAFPNQNSHKQVDNQPPSLNVTHMASVLTSPNDTTATTQHQNNRAVQWIEIAVGP